MVRPLKISLRDAIGRALHDVRAEWRFVLVIAALAAGASGVALMALGGTLIWPVAILLLSAGVYAALTRLALSGSAPVAGALARDTLRVLAAGAIVTFFIGVFALLALYVTLGILIGPYSNQAKALAEANDQAGMTALMQRAVSEHPNVLLVALVVAGVILLALTSRFFLAAPQSLDRQRIMVFDSWRLTRGNMLKVIGARLWLLGPAIVLASALQSLFGMAIGLDVGNFLALAAQAQSNPLAFVGFFTVSQFLQIAIYSSLEAALAVALYRALARPASTDS